MRTIHVILDSLNRHYLSIYNSEAWVKTPNIERLAARGISFDNHWVGSLPCMPARREMMTGRLNFLETNWGPIQPWDKCLPEILRQQSGTYSHLITDHYHYFHAGGDGYHDLFSSWEFQRGQEGDVWRPIVDGQAAPEGTRGKCLNRGAYWNNQQMLDKEDDLAYPTPQCFERAIDFIEQNKTADNWHLQLECFDPHEPFDCPKKYRDIYDDGWDKYQYTWPDYNAIDPEHDDEEAIAHIRKCYAGTLSMADTWLGKFLDKMDECDLWSDTTLIFTTDHGHLLGEHGYWAKNYMFDYKELAHIPLIVCSPDAKAGSRNDKLTTTIDLMPTFLELHNATEPDTVQGKSICHLFADESAEHHDAILYGYFSKDVNMTHGEISYCRQPLDDSELYNFTMPSAGRRISDQEINDAECGAFLPYTTHPVFKIKTTSHRHHNAQEHNLIYNIVDDPEQQNRIDDPELEAELAEKMRDLLRAYQAPEEQYTRLGLETK